MSTPVTRLPLRLLRQAVALVTGEYGGGYLDRRIYHPPCLLWAVLSGGLTLFCVREGDRLKGTIAIRKTSLLPGAAEIGMQVVAKTCRQQGLGATLVHFAIQYALQQKMSCCFGHCVTGHSISQAALERYGFIPCGLLFSRCDEQQLYPQKPSEGRHTLAVLVWAGSVATSPVLYPPQSLILATAQYYLEWGATICPQAGHHHLPLHTQLRVVNDAVHRSCELFVLYVGADFAQVLPQALQGKPHRCDWSFTVYLNLLQPSCPQAYCILQQHGFFFAGFHAHCKGAEYLLLHAEAAEIDFGQLCATPRVYSLIATIEPFYTARRQEGFLTLWEKGGTNETFY